MCNMELTEEQKQLLQNTKLMNGKNAWDYVQSWESEENQYWIAAGILSLMKKGHPLNRLTIFWEAEDLQNPPKKDEEPMRQHAPSKELKEKLTEEQLQQIRELTLSSGMSAWDYVLTCDDDAQYWVALGILSCVEHDYGLNKLVINWEARELRYTNSADCAQSSENQIPILTEEQQQLLQQTALTDGTNVWKWVQQQRKEDQPWAAAGILSCIDKGYDLNEAMICWEARELRYKE